MSSLLFVLLFVLAIVQSTYAAYCGISAIPFRFEVLASGRPVFGCATPQCFGTEDGGLTMAHDSRFDTIDGEVDGFVRESDKKLQRSRYTESKAQQAACSGSFNDASCSSANNWVGGIDNTNRSGTINGLSLQCCNYEGLRFGTEAGRVTVRAGEVYSGGEVLRSGRQTGFDLISNVMKKVDSTDGRYTNVSNTRFSIINFSITYELTIHRMNCIPDPPEPVNEVSFDVAKDIVRILDKVPAVAAGAPAYVSGGIDDGYATGGAVVGEQIQVAAPVDCVPSAAAEGCVEPIVEDGYYYPVLGSVPECFTADTLVRSIDGTQLRMDELKIGDRIMTVVDNETTYAPVTSFLHRLPYTRTHFIQLETADGHILRLTPQHFIYTLPCDASHLMRNAVFARDVSVGDCIYRLTTDASGLLPSRVIRIDTIDVIGAYSPMTSTGDVIVNDVLASCHNVIRSQSLFQSFFYWIQRMEMWQRSLFRVNAEPEEVIQLPIGVEYLYSMLEYIVPISLLS